MEGRDGRTEKATGKKRREERRKGNLCISQEVGSLSVLLLGFIGVRLSANRMAELVTGVMKESFSFSKLGPWDAGFAKTMFVDWGINVVSVMAPIFGMVLAGGVLSTMVQTGPYFSMQALRMHFSSLNPVSGVKRLFNAQAAVTLGISLLKIGLVALVLYYILRNERDTVLSLAGWPADYAFAWTMKTIFRMGITVAAIFTVVAILDWCFRKYKYEQGIMMTKQEVKDERRQEEVNPVVRRQQNRRMRELSLLRMMAAVPKAQVVITNPTHVAVALRYDPNTMDAPKVVAKGLRLMAERIKRVAKENNVPIVERPELARALYKHVRLGQVIPSKFYEAVAGVLAYLHTIGRGIRMAA